MNLKSITGYLSNKLDKTNLSDSVYSKRNSRQKKKIRALEKTIISQGESTYSGYLELTKTVNSNNINISSKAIKDSVRSRIKKNKKLYAIDEFLSREPYKELDLARINELFNNVPIEVSLIADAYLEYCSIVKEAVDFLKDKLIISYLISLKSKTNKLLKSISQIPIIESFLEFFDQVFTLKDVEITYSNFHNSFNINVKTKIIQNGQSIYGFIPITHRT